MSSVSREQRPTPRSASPPWEELIRFSPMRSSSRQPKPIDISKLRGKRAIDMVDGDDDKDDSRPKRTMRAEGQESGSV